MTCDLDDLPDGMTVEELGRCMYRYDIESGRSSGRPHPADLEGLVIALEIAALFLTTYDGQVFTPDLLIKQALDCAVDGASERDIRTVLAGAKFLRKVRGGYVLR